jgi:hypothetical protein
MYYSDDPDEMTSEERFQEVAAILAAGCLRLKAGFKLPIETTIIEEPSLFTENSLDFPGNRSLNWTKG